MEVRNLSFIKFKFFSHSFQSFNLRKKKSGFNTERENENYFNKFTRSTEAGKCWKDDEEVEINVKQFTLKI